jgi:hypothetical protein
MNKISDKLGIWASTLKEFVSKKSKWYKIYIESLINVGFAGIGNTAGIWMGYIIIKFVFTGVFENLSWPGLSSLIQDGVILIISFSFLSSALYHSTRRLKINISNTLSIVFIVAIALFYARVIALEQTGEERGIDEILSVVSIVAFAISLIIYYGTLAYERYIQHTDFAEKRDSDYDEMSKDFAR